MWMPEQEAIFYCLPVCLGKKETAVLPDFELTALGVPVQCFPYPTQV